MQTLRRIFGVRWMYEGALSLLIAWMVIWRDRMRSHPALFPNWQQSKFLSYIYWKRVITEPGTVLEQVFWSLLLGVILFCFLRLLARLRCAPLLLGTVGGAIALVGFPMFYILGLSYALPNALPRIAFLELLTVVILASAFYLQRNRSVLLQLTIVAVVFHCCYWAWLTENYVNPANLLYGYAPWTVGFWIASLFYFGFPLFSLASALLWAAFVKQKPLYSPSGV